MSMRLTLFSVLVFALMTPEAVLSKGGGGGKNKDRVMRDFRHTDTNGDNKISRAEWNRRGNFDRLDRNGDGTLSLKEVRKMYAGHGDKNYTWPPKNQTLRFPDDEIDPTIAQDRIDAGQLNPETICGIYQSKQCSIKQVIASGLIATGTGPMFPEGANCLGVDDFWAMDYGHKRNIQVYHGGADIPAPWGTPMLAVADGAVVAMFEAHQSKRGIEVVVRHSPENTGLPMWTYSTYGHLDKMPDLKVGQRIKMGDIIGPTGNTGISSRGTTQSKSRRPAIHFATFFAPGPKYGEVNDVVIPVDGLWLDPFAFYRQKPPFNSRDVKALPNEEKGVNIPVMFEDGTTSPSDTKLIWPYTCSRN